MISEATKSFSFMRFSVEIRKFILIDPNYPNNISTLVILFRQTEIVLKDSTAFVYVMKSEKSSH